MFVTDEMIREMEERYGVPLFRQFEISSTPEEVRRIASTQRDGRNHDVTLYVHKGDEWIVIAKHPYPQGLYRSPSGGLHPGETFLEGINREVTEELGCTVELERFLLATDVRFYADPHAADNARIVFPSVQWRDVPVGDVTEVKWRSWVFLAKYVAGDFRYTDHHEIREVRLAKWAEFAKFTEIMKAVGHGGLRYRAALHEAVEGALEGIGFRVQGVGEE